MQSASTIMRPKQFTPAIASILAGALIYAFLWIAGPIARIESTLEKHTKTLASHSTKLDAILGTGLSEEFTALIREKVNAKTR